MPMPKKIYLLTLCVLFVLSACTPSSSDFVEHEPMIPMMPTTHEVPILMYHYVRHVDKNADPLGWNLSVTPELLDQQLAYLAAENYNTIHLEDLLEGKIPENPIVLTFDDGLEDFYTDAFPLLKKYDFTASNGIVTEFIGAPAHMNLEQIQEIHEAGIELSSHTLTHADLETSASEEVRRQVKDSKSYLDQTFGLNIRILVYPAGRFDEEAVQILKEEGYELAVTTQYGEANLLEDEILLLPRIRIDNRDGFEGFRSKLQALR